MPATRKNGSLSALAAAAARASAPGGCSGSCGLPARRRGRRPGACRRRGIADRLRRSGARRPRWWAPRTAPRSGSRRRTSCWILANRRTAISEWPPSSKKLSRTPTWFTPSSPSQKPDQRLLDLVARRQVLALQLRARELGLRLGACSGRRSPGRPGGSAPAGPCELTMHLVARRHRADLRQHALQRPPALGRGDALAQAVLERRLRRRQLALAPCPLQLQVAGASAAWARRSRSPPAGAW